jgi:tetrapyrrole methylase family protein / MazG family protein
MVHEPAIHPTRLSVAGAVQAQTLPLNAGQTRGLDALARLGLTGSCQIHRAPVRLGPDRRGHQVFEGFEKDWANLVGWAVGRLGDAAEARILWAGQVWSGSLAEAGAQPPGVLVVLARPDGFSAGLEGLVQVVDRLLGPGGCPWDQAQTHESLKKHLSEEAYELFEAIDRADSRAMLEELGDVLLQPVMHAQIRARAGGWDSHAVAEAVTEKLVRRHPHVFGDATATTPEEVLRNWDASKSKEGQGRKGRLEGVPNSMPAIARALEVSRRAARCGFEWPDLDGVWDKLAEEERELRQAVAEGHGIGGEIGDLLFTVVNLARWLDTDPEEALRKMLDRFSERFARMEAAAGDALEALSPEDWDRLWNEAKAAG